MSTLRVQGLRPAKPLSYGGAAAYRVRGTPVLPVTAIKSRQSRHFHEMVIATRSPDRR